MCNEAARRIALGIIREDFSELKIPLRFPEGLPNLAPLDSIRITDVTAIIRSARDPAEPDAAELIQRRWSWPAPGGKPLYNMRAEGRGFTNHAEGGRCLIPIDGFYEFTAPPPGTKLKSKWLFTPAHAPFVCIAGIWRRDPAVGEAFTMLTAAPGPDVAPYHSRQIVLMPRDRWADWLGGAVPAPALITPPPAGTFTVTQLR
jgi:putative SOS response-associated peptidase YedK